MSKAKSWRTQSHRGHAVVSKRTGKPIRYTLMHGKSLPRTVKLAKMTQIEHDKLEKSLEKITQETKGLARKLKARGYKGWTVGIGYKDGSTEVIHTIAKGYKDALVHIEPKMSQKPENVYELVVVDPAIAAVLKLLGAGARKALSLAARGAKFIAKKAILAPKTVARAVGRAVAYPQVLREEAAIGREEELAPYREEAPSTFKGEPFSGKPFASAVEDTMGIPKDVVQIEHIKEVDRRTGEVVQEVPVGRKVIKRITTVEEFVEP